MDQATLETEGPRIDRGREIVEEHKEIERLIGLLDAGLEIRLQYKVEGGFVDDTHVDLVTFRRRFRDALVTKKAALEEEFKEL